MLHSRGEILLMLDADGATKITDLEKLENQVSANQSIFQSNLFEWSFLMKVKALTSKIVK